MSPFLDDLEAQLTEAARARARSRRRRLGRWPAALRRNGLVLAAAALTVAVVVGAFALLGRSRPATPSARPAANPGELMASIPPARLRRELAYMTVATRGALAAPACRAQPVPFPHTTIIHGSPGGDLLSILGVLRRPATAADRLPRQDLQMVGEPIYAGWERRARVAHGTSYWIVPVRFDAASEFPSARCFALQRAALRRYAPRIPGSVRRQTLRLQDTLIAYDGRLAAISPRDELCLLTVGSNDQGASCGVTAANIEANGAGVDVTQGTVSELVPDGVATVTLRFPARAGHPAASVTGRVVDNVFVLRLGALAGRLQSEAPDEPTSVWRAADGRVIRTIVAPSPAKLRSLCRRQPLTCVIATGYSSSAGNAVSSAGSSVSATAAAPQRGR